MAEVLGKRNFDQLTLDDNTVLTTASNLDDVSDVSASSPSTDDYLKWNGSAWVPASVGGGIFGSEFQQASSDTQSTTTSTTFQQKLRLTTGTLPSGTYRIAWYYEYHISSTTYDFEGRVQIGDSTTIHEIREEAQDAGTDQWEPCGGFYYHTGSGVLNIDLDYCRSSASGGTAYIRKARLEIWRVS